MMLNIQLWSQKSMTVYYHISQDIFEVSTRSHQSTDRSASLINHLYWRVLLEALSRVFPGGFSSAVVTFSSKSPVGLDKDGSPGRKPHKAHFLSDRKSIYSAGKDTLEMLPNLKCNNVMIFKHLKQAGITLQKHSTLITVRFSTSSITWIKIIIIIFFYKVKTITRYCLENMIQFLKSNICIVMTRNTGL